MRPKPAPDVAPPSRGNPAPGRSRSAGRGTPFGRTGVRRAVGRGAAAGLLGGLLLVPPLRLPADRPILSGWGWGPGPLAAQAPRLVEVERGSLARGAGSLYWEVAGEGPALLLLHDGLNHSGVWDAAFAAFARDHRVVRFDRRGYGRSDPPVLPHSPVEDVAAVLDAAGIERATLAGASAGGGLTLAFALEHPERVEALVLVGAVIPGYGYSEHFTARGFRNMAPLLDGEPGKSLRNWIEDPWILAPGNKEGRKRLRRLLEPWFERHVAQRPDLERLPEPDLMSRLPEIEAPTLVLVGEADIPDVHAQAGALETLLPDARRAVVPEAGHLLFFERPDAFERLVREFLAEVRPPPGDFAQPPAWR